MSDAVRTDPAAAAQRVREGVRELALGAIGAAGDLAADVAEGYRRSTVHSRLRIAVVAAWVALSLATLWIACPSSGPTNGLGAKTRLLLRSQPGVFTGTQVLVENDSDRIWRDVVVTLEGGWRFDKKTVRPQDKLVVAIAQFRRDGESPPPELEPRSITIECSEGRVTTPLQPAR